MATTALIGVQLKDGRIMFRRKPSDGYPSEVVPYLLNNWNNYKKASKLELSGDELYEKLRYSNIDYANSEEEFLKSYTMNEIVDMLYDILKDVESAEENGIDCTELDYYESVLS